MGGYAAGRVCGWGEGEEGGEGRILREGRREEGKGRRDREVGEREDEFEGEEEGDELEVEEE